MSDLARFTSAELLELRTRILAAATKFYARGSELIRQGAALPELRTPDLVDKWQSLQSAAAVAIAAGAEAFELLADIAIEVTRRHAARSTCLEGMTAADAIRYLESGNADA